MGWLVSSTSAVPLYGVSNEGDIYKIDQATSTRELFMISTGVAWIDATDGPSPDAFFATGDGGSLYTVDIVNKTLATAGNYGGAMIRTLAYAEPATAGAAGVLYGSDFENLFTIDLDDGEAHLVGAIRIGGGGFLYAVNAMDFDPVAGKLFIVNRSGTISTLYSVDSASGIATAVGPLGGGTLPVTDIWYDRDTNQMYGIHKSNTQLYQIDTTNGQATPIGPTPNGADACPNILGLGSINVPEPGMLVLLGAGLVGLALPMFRRRRH
jgi:DNA-binding beta-propeller fold protein YncE